MLSMATSSTLHTTFTCHSFRYQKSFNTPFCLNKNPILKKTIKTPTLTASAATEAVTETETPSDFIIPQKPEVVVKQVGKPRLVLKFIWMEKNIGLALDQVIPGHGTVPLSPYFFWPRKDAWEELKATLETVTETETPSDFIIPQKPEVVVKQVGKPRLVLKFIWMEKNIGLALDQVIPGHGTVPLSPYFFWPRKDAWEELKATLESKPWISQKKMIILLNQATDIINLWQQSGGNLAQS
ncbi:hypothetical protein GOBAR_AA03951 [Gossypium barbadense]|uniref:Ribosomal protein PSRP-3/Ycf65 n=1 Tax=Gossypium barbadense TaxID=3634 RepID=A0A2P5YM54_GOSBA|nr:hypothetical protein GOBAR_AA03951 [Gossypium barbadense]